MSKSRRTYEIYLIKPPKLNGLDKRQEEDHHGNSLKLLTSYLYSLSKAREILDVKNCNGLPSALDTYFSQFTA